MQINARNCGSIAHLNFAYYEYSVKAFQVNNITNMLSFCPSDLQNAGVVKCIVAVIAVFCPMVDNFYDQNRMYVYSLVFYHSSLEFNAVFKIYFKEMRFQKPYRFDVRLTSN